MAGDVGRRDGRGPARPPRSSTWIADHRGLVRGLLVLVGLALLAAVLVRLVGGGNWGVLLVQALFWSWLTYQAGWALPRTVDRWRAQDRSD